MAIFTTTIAAAFHWGSAPKPLVYKPLAINTQLEGVTTIMNDEGAGVNEAQTGPYGFLYELANLDHTTGVVTQTDLGKELGVVEGVIRGAAKAISKAVPIDRLKEGGKGKLTALGVALVKACVNRQDVTLEAWVHGLMEAMKAPELKQLAGHASTAGDIDLSFMDDQIAATADKGAALALRASTELQTLLALNAKLSAKTSTLTEEQIRAAEEEGYQNQMAILTARFRGEMLAKQAFLRAQEQLGDMPNIP